MRAELSQSYQILKEDGLSEVCKAASRYVNRRYYDVRNGSKYNTNGVSVLDEDWDNLIILDAFRFDYFKEYNTIEGELGHRISRGSTTKEFIWGNFTDQKRYDTVYLSDNPWYGRIHDRIRSDLYHFSLCERDAFDGVVSYPWTVTETAIEYNKKYDDKRLIVHYLQPHGPYFTSDGTDRLSLSDDNFHEKINEGYVNNIELVLPEVEKLVENLVGKTVVTSDHGELLGKRLFPFPLRQYQHHLGIYVEELVKVPWLVVDGEERKDITAENRAKRWDHEAAHSKDVKEQLERLGYAV